MRIALQMDPLSAIRPANDSTLLLGHEACRRGHAVWHYTPDTLSRAADGRILAHARSFVIHSLGADWKYTLGAPEHIDLSGMDVLLLRQDPPFNMAYITSTHMLEMLAHGPKAPLIVNDPAMVRNHPEKWFPLHFPDLIPPTLISRDLELLKAFRKEQGEIVLKPLYSYSGRSVFHIAKDDKNFPALLEMFFDQSKEPIIAQKFLPQVQKEEKRIIIIDDYIVPAENRVPPEGEIRAAVRIGATTQKIELTAGQRRTIERMIPEFQKCGLLLVGLDMIGDYVTEINITSPAGLVEIGRMYNLPLGEIFWDKIEAKRK